MSIKKIIFLGVIGILFLGGFLCWAAPKWDGAGLSDKTYNLSVSEGKSLKDNVRELFYPGAQSDLRRALRVIGVGILIIFLVRNGYQLVLQGDDESAVKKARMNLIYILYGAFLFFGVEWILSVGLGIESLGGTRQLVENIQSNLFLQILGFFKAFAFFLAIVMVMYYGFMIMKAMDQEDKIKLGRKGIINVVLALVFIKLIDYLYYIAQYDSFKERAGNLAASIAKVMGFVLGAIMVIVVFYGGFQLAASRGNEENYKKGLTILKTVFLVAIVVLLFVLIIYQVINEFNY